MAAVGSRPSFFIIKGRRYDVSPPLSPRGPPGEKHDRHTREHPSSVVSSRSLPAQGQKTALGELELPSPRQRSLLTQKPETVSLGGETSMGLLCPLGPDQTQCICVPSAEAFRDKSQRPPEAPLQATLPYPDPPRQEGSGVQ